MPESIAAQVKRLQGMTVPELRQRWREVFEEETGQRDRETLIRRLAREIQLRHFGEDEAPLPRPDPSQSPDNPPPRRQARAIRDTRLPRPGTILTRSYKGHELKVTVRERDFVFRGRTYRSLSAIASEVAGCRYNGFAFFKLTKDLRK